MSHCTSCGKPLTPGLAFCTACGATIGAASAPPPAPGMPPMAIVPARPAVDASAVISESFRLVFRNFGAFLATQGVFILIGSVLALAITLAYIRPVMSATMGDMAAFSEDPESFDLGAFLLRLLPLVIWGGLSGVLVGLFSLIGAGFGYVTADLLRAGETATFGAVWAKLGPRFGSYFATALLVRLAIIGIVLAGAVLFFLVLPIVAAIVFAIVLYLRWALAGPASIYEARAPGENLKRSTELTRGVRGDLFVLGLVAIGVTIVPGIVVGVVLGIVSPPATDLSAAFEPPPVWVDVVRWAFGAAAQMVSSFFLSAAFMAFYRRLAV